jgi:TonB family protein
MWRESAVQALSQALTHSRVRAQGSAAALKSVGLAGTGLTLLTSVVVAVIMFGRLAKPAHQAMSAPRNTTSEIHVGKPSGAVVAAANSMASSESLSTKPATVRSHAEGSRITSVPEGTAGHSRITIGEIAHPTVKTAVRLTSSEAPSLVAAQATDLFMDITNSMFQNVGSEPGSPDANIDHQFQGPKLVSSPPPIYPSQARMEKIQGVVVIDALVDPMGKVADTKVISGPAGLVQAAVDSLHTWRYQPALLHGQPIAMHVKVNINFNLH